MQYYHIVLFLLAVAIALSTIAPKIKIPYPVLLMAVGMIVGFIPGFQHVPVRPDVIFLLFLPPLLYDAAVNIHFKEFKANIHTISIMAVLLVFATMLAIAIVVYHLIPDISLPVALVIGAILSPPDAVAASGITKSLSLPHRTITIIEGESLINDASALTAYRVALGVAIGGSFTFWEAGLEFCVTIIGGVLIGFGMAYLFCFTLKKIKLSSTGTVSLNFLLPFVAYLVAEELNVSGVLAVVIMGIQIAKHVKTDGIFSDITKKQSKSLWATIIYLLSGLIFILIGLEFPQVLDQIPPDSVIPLIISAFVIFIIALIIRILIVFCHKLILDRDSGKLFSRKRRKTQNVRRLSWQESLIIGWSGMRGIVSVATALALPAVMTNGDAFPERNSIIFLTVVVVILMLLIQGLGLPLLIKWLKIEIKEKDIEAQEYEWE